MSEFHLDDNCRNFNYFKKKIQKNPKLSLEVLTILSLMISLILGRWCALNVFYR